MADSKRDPSTTRTHCGPSRTLEVYAEAKLPTTHGDFRTIVFREKKTGLEHVAMVMGEIAGCEGLPVRVHSECMTSEVFGSLKCDCKAQLDHALDYIAKAGAGAVVYLRQEGRGIGFGNKIRAYALQEQGHDTYEANRMLGFPDDLRRYDVAAEILRLLGVRSVELITNNPLKIAALVDEGIPVRRRIPSIAPVQSHNRGYLVAKVEHSGHLIDLPPLDDESSDSKAG
jgi:GTP cyclohydrolase II/3,4-dihydroxy 2-butanone 4-phosphate synthase/GTP cyclohydrolase II